MFEKIKHTFRGLITWNKNESLMSRRLTLSPSVYIRGRHSGQCNPSNNFTTDRTQWHRHHHLHHSLSSRVSTTSCYVSVNCWPTTTVKQSLKYVKVSSIWPPNKWSSMYTGIITPTVHGHTKVVHAAQIAVPVPYVMCLCLVYDSTTSPTSIHCCTNVLHAMAVLIITTYKYSCRTHCQ